MIEAEFLVELQCQFSRTKKKWSKPLPFQFHNIFLTLSFLMSSASFSSRPGPKFTALKSDRLLSPGSVTPPRRSGWKSPVSLRLDSPRTAGGGTDTASGPRLSRGRRRRPDGVHVSRGWGWGWVGSAAMGGGTARNVEGRVIGVAALEDAGGPHER